MRQLDPKKLADLPSFNEHLDETYGKPGSPQREQFNEDAIAWFYGNMLRERHRELKLTQKQVAEELGLKQSYIARVENG